MKRAALIRLLAFPGILAACAGQAQVFNLHNANQGYSHYGGYNVLMYGQGAAIDPGNNIWNGFGKYGGPGSTDFYGPANPDSGHGSVPNGNPGQPYAWYSGTSIGGPNLFTPTNPVAPNTGNATSAGTISPIRVSLTYGFDNGANGGVAQGQPSWILSHAAVVNGANPLGSVTLSNVPNGTYNLYLYGANFDGTRGASFTITTGGGTAVGGITNTINPNAAPTGSALNAFVLGVTYVEFTNVVPVGGVISANWGPVSNPNSGLSGEGDFNGLQLVRVPPDYALDLDGVSAQVVINSNASLTLSNQLTLEAWINPTDASLATILSRGDGEYLNDYILNVGYGGTITGNMNVGFYAAGQWDFSLNVVPTNAWTHVAVTYDGTNKVFYINGVLDHSAHVPGTIYESGSPIFIGRQGTTCNCNFFHGHIDEVRIWNTVRSVADISLNQSVTLSGETNLMAYYRFDEGGGATAHDFTGNGNTGVLTNGAGWRQVYPYTPAAFALSFDGVSSYVQFATNQFLNALSNTVTFEAWVYPTGPVCLNTILSRGDGNNANTDYIVQIGDDGSSCSGRNLAFFAAGGWDASYSPIPSNTWTHVAVTYDGNVKQFFINGVLDRTVSRPGSLFQSSSPLYIGRQGNACNCNFFRGIIDEVRIFNTARTQANIMQNKNAFADLADQHLIAYYQFDEGTGTLTGDSAYVNVGGLSNGPAWVTSSAPIIAPPGLYMNPASGITAASATLSGFVHPHFEASVAWFEYGPDTNLGSMTPPTNLPPATSFLSITSTISSLTPLTTYYYRLDASNHDGTTYYPSERQLTTLGPPKVNITSSGVVPGSIIVYGTIDPRNTLASYYFEYGTNITYGSTTSTGSVVTAGPVNGSFPTLPARPYHFRLVASSVYGTSYTPDYTTNSFSAPPAILSSFASQVTSNSATLNAVINPNGSVTMVGFVYGTNTGYGLLTGTDSIGPVITNVTVSFSLSGLVPLTQYHFKAQAINGVGEVFGSDQTFFTSPPLVTTSPADQVASAHATLHAAVNPNAAPTVAWFEYGLTPGYGFSTPPLDMGSGTVALAASAPLSNLSPGALYNFHAVASNSIGLSYGSNLTFPTAPVASIIGISGPSNGQFLLQFSGTTGINYTLQSSTNLTQWLDLTTLSAGSNGLFNYVDPGSNQPALFYRLSNP